MAVGDFASGVVTGPLGAWVELDDGTEATMEFAGFAEECLIIATMALIARATTNATDQIVFVVFSGFRDLFVEEICRFICATPTTH
jgi:hypothetical protein